MSQALRIQEARGGRESVTLHGDFPLEGGRSIRDLTIAYETWGELNRERDNAVLVCHALTGSAHAATRGPGDGPGWWEGLIGPGRPLDPERHFVICSNVLGSCCGTSGPSSVDPGTGLPYRGSFPEITTQDMVRAQKALLDHLGLPGLSLVIGGSLGAMQVWRWLVDFPGYARAGIPIAGTPQASPWAIALNAVARQAIFGDPAWEGGDYDGEGPGDGLALARMIATISYRSARQFGERFGRERAISGPADPPAAGGDFQVERYLRHQGRKLPARFDARSYVTLTRAMDLHDAAFPYGSLEGALARVEARVQAVGIQSDVLFDPSEIRSAVSLLRRLGAEASYAEIRSPLGHDAFLVEYPQLNTLVSDFIERRTQCAF
jgi:homoserine O-acetyltransferase/O-succinyltransferase